MYERTIKKLNNYLSNVLSVDGHVAVIHGRDNYLNWEGQNVYVIGTLDGVQYLMIGGSYSWNPNSSFDIFKTDEDGFAYYVDEKGDKVFVGAIPDVLYTRVLLGAQKYYSYKYFGSSNSNVWVAAELIDGTFYGGSHRARMLCTPGKPLQLTDDSILLSHGCTEGCEEYEKETENISRIKEMMDSDGVITPNREDCLFILYRLAEATG